MTLPGGVTQAMPRYYRDRVFPQVVREIMNERTQIQLDSKYWVNVREAGGSMEYERSRSAAINAAMSKFYSQRYSQRDKL